MAQLNFFQRSKFNYRPVAYATTETRELFPVAAGDLVGPVFMNVRVAFDGTTPTLSLGDDGDVDRFMTTTTAAATVTGLKQGIGGSGSTYLAIGQHLYVAANTIDVVYTYTAVTATGYADIWCYIAKVNPH